VAAIGFAFDTYELLMTPIVARKALASFLNVDPFTDAGNDQILAWTGYITYASAVCGGIFGLLGGFLTDRFGRKRVMFWSIMLYALSPFAAAFSTSAWMLLVLRCTTFIGVCVEFVAAVTWIAELFPEPRRREAALGYTQAFASVGGLLLSAIYKWVIIPNANSFPAILGEHAFWRYTLISGLLPAIPMILILPFLPESPAWLEKKTKGTLRRPRLGELFQPALKKTTIVSTIMFACSLGAAFGALQLAPQIIPGLMEDAKETKELQVKYNKLDKEIQEIAKKGPGEEVPKALEAEKKEINGQLIKLDKERESTIGGVNLIQELGGLFGRCMLAVLAMYIVSRRNLLRMFQWPGLIVVPVVFALFAGSMKDLELFKWGMFAAGFFTVAQLSFWGNYLPCVYPLHLRGTGESFSANVGGRMLGTSAQVATTQLALILPGVLPFIRLSYAAAIVAFSVYLIGSILCFWLPEPKTESLQNE
jgi:hypothetical protein